MMLAFCVAGADAAVSIKNDTAAKFAADMEMEANEAGAIATLENDIRILDEEIRKCENKKKGWIAATVIGSAGIVATGVAAGVQGAQIKDQKNTMAAKKEELKDLKQEYNQLQYQTNE